MYKDTVSDDMYAKAYAAQQNCADSAPQTAIPGGTGFCGVNSG